MIDIYLATPYSDPDATVRQMRHDMVTELAQALVKRGLTVFSPITYGIAFEEHIGSDWQAWAEFDRKFICASKELWVYTQPGWQNSVGVNAEILIANEAQIPVAFVPYGGNVIDRAIEVMVHNWHVRYGLKAAA
jgi:hypothetical protein